MALKEILSNNPLMMSVAFIAGLLLGGFPVYNSEMITLALIVMMTLSLGGLNLRNLELRAHARTTLIAVLLSFGVCSGITILLAFLFEDPLRSGWIVEAAVPSAVAVIPFTFLMKGNVENSLVSSAAIYFLSLIMTPMLLLLFVGRTVSVTSLMTSVSLLILLPLLLSRGVRRMRMRSETRTILINLSFFVVILAVVGSNRQYFFGDLPLILSLLGASFFRIFVPGLLVIALAAWLKVEGRQRVNMSLFATYKNTGMAAALAVTLIGAEAALPAAICTPVEIIWLIFLTKFIFPQRPSAKEATDR